MTDDPQTEAARTFRAASGPVSLVLCCLLALFLLGDAVLRAGWGQGLLLAPWILLGLWVVYVLSFVSMLRVDHDGAMVQNLLRRTSFGWAHVRDIDLRWQLEFTLDDDSRITCFGGPTKSRPVRRRAAGEEQATAPAGLRELTDIRDRWTAAAGTANAPVRRTWDGAALIALAVIALAATASVLIAYG